MKLEIGQKIKTNYGSGPYEITKIFRRCRCTHALNQFDNIESPLPEHVHIEMKYLGDDEYQRSGYCGLGYYNEETFEAYNKHGKPNGDRIILLPNYKPIQQSLFHL